MSVSVLLADAQPIVRQGFRAILEQIGFEIAGEAANGHEAVKLSQSRVPDVAVLDLFMPQLNGLDAAREIRRLCPRTRIILLMIHTEEYLIVAALRAGIRGCVLKTQGADDLVQAIREVARGGTYLSPGISQIVVDAYLAGRGLPPDPLTPRERQVLQLVAEGKTTKETAAFLALSVKTAETYRARLMAKLDIHDTASLVRYAIRNGIIQA